MRLTERSRAFFKSATGHSSNRRSTRSWAFYVASNPFDSRGGAVWVVHLQSAEQCAEWVSAINSVVRLGPAAFPTPVTLLQDALKVQAFVSLAHLMMIGGIGGKGGREKPFYACTASLVRLPGGGQIVLRSTDPAVQVGIGWV